MQAAAAAFSLKQPPLLLSRARGRNGEGLCRHQQGSHQEASTLWPLLSQQPPRAGHSATVRQGLHLRGPEGRSPLHGSPEHREKFLFPRAKPGHLMCKLRPPFPRWLWSTELSQKAKIAGKNPGLNWGWDGSGLGGLQQGPCATGSVTVQRSQWPHKALVTPQRNLEPFCSIPQSCPTPRPGLTDPQSSPGSAGNRNIERVIFRSKTRNQRASQGLPCLWLSLHGAPGSSRCCRLLQRGPARRQNQHRPSCKAGAPLLTPPGYG